MDMRHNTIDFQRLSARQRIVYNFAETELIAAKSRYCHTDLREVAYPSCNRKASITVRRNPMEAPKS